MYELLVFVAVALAGILVDRIMGNHLPRERKNFPKGLQIEKRGLLMSSFYGFSLLFAGLLADEYPSIETMLYVGLAMALLLTRMFRLQWWYEDFIWR